MQFTHRVLIIRGILMRGAPRVDMQVPALELVVFLAVTLAIATLRFHKRLDRR